MKSPFGLGKVEGTSAALANLFYAMASESAQDEDAGSVSETGRWYGLFRGPFRMRDLKEGWPEESGYITSEDERALMRARGGVIITEDSQGFVGIKLYPSQVSIERKWAKIEEELGVLIRLKDRQRGSIWLRLRDGIVIGAMGSEPGRFIGKTLDEAKHIARYGGTGRRSRQ